jgi:hypothetical protein
VVAAFLAGVAKTQTSFSPSDDGRADCMRGIVELLEFSNDEKEGFGTTTTQQFPAVFSPD